MQVADRITRILAAEGVEFITGFPENRLFNAAARIGIRPVIARTERVAVNIADAYTRMSAGRRIGVCAVQYGPGAEAAFAAVAQAYGDSTPMLVIPSAYANSEQSVDPNFSAEETYRRITSHAVTLRDWSHGPEVFRRAFSLLRSGVCGPVLIAVADDLLNSESGEDDDGYVPAGRRHVSAADPADVAELAAALVAAERPVIMAGQGVLYAQASEQLQALAELTQTPVVTTLNGKSAFPEDHPLAAGTAGRSRPATVDHVLAEADFILGVGTSFTRSDYITPLPAGRAMGQIVNDPRTLGKCVGAGIVCVGDARVVLAQVVERLHREHAADLKKPRAEAIAALDAARAAFRADWRPRLTSEESPISPYRIVQELMGLVDRARTVVTHDAGNPRDQIVPFYESVVPHGYIGWGKTTQLGSGLGFAMGARLARPDWLAVNIMGDAAFGMVGMDFETAVRADLPILTIVFNNGVMGGYRAYMPDAVEAYGANRVNGDYAAIARALGGHGERVERAEDLRQGLERCLARVRAGQAALLDVATREEPHFPLGTTPASAAA